MAGGQADVALMGGKLMLDGVCETFTAAMSAPRTWTGTGILARDAGSTSVVMTIAGGTVVYGDR